MEDLTTAAFKEKIFDFEKNDEWKYNGTVPSIIDFWAEWCGPCRMLSPVLEEIARENEGKFNVYKVNIDEEADVAMAFGIQSIPSLLFIPVGEMPQKMIGAHPKGALMKAVKEVLKVE